jgi:predicted metal-dependent phosphoesterase TrpH
MPIGQPFTVLCQQLARPRAAGRADLHVHTTYSDGSYRPAQVVELARRCGLSAVAITDHDTTAGVGAALLAAAAGPEVIAGVEITAEAGDRELHLLGYFVELDDVPLQTALAALRRDRVGRFWEMVARLRRLGVQLPDDVLADVQATGTLGRRNLADMMVRAGQAATVREAFQRYLGDFRRAAVPKRRLPVGEAVALVRGAGGVAAWAHPTYDCTRATLTELHALGMRGVEADFQPAGRVAGVTSAAGRPSSGWRSRAAAIATGRSRRAAASACAASPRRSWRHYGTWQGAEDSHGFSRHHQQDQAGPGQDARPVQQRRRAVHLQGKGR